jgi:hypothetical protein
VKKTILILTLVVLLVCVVAAQMPGKIWFYVAGKTDNGNLNIIYIEDRETGTRCYAVAPATVNVYPQAASISCVKR